MNAITVTKKHKTTLHTTTAEVYKIRNEKHCPPGLHVHAVLVTKFRHKVSTDRRQTRLKEILRTVCTDFETELVEFNGDNNHVHLLVKQPQWRLQPTDAPGVPRPGPALLPGKQTMVRFVLSQVPSAAPR